MGDASFANVAQIQGQEDAHEMVIDGLWDFYSQTMLPLEEATRFDVFNTSTITEGEMRAPPIVLLVGPYSAGKTSFIRYLVGRDFPGQRIGPEPTTDKFVAVMHGPEDRIVPGNALTVAPMSPFGGLKYFGNGFLTRFEGSIMNNDVLKRITLVDTPGILSGEKQRLGRDYDFSSVISWFAERADLIIVMFDAHKLDVSDELRNVLQTLRPQQDKMRILLNKADSIDGQQLMRVYGALMWSLGKVLGTPEVCRVYTGSFWDGPLRNQENAKLLIKEKESLLAELSELSDRAVLRRINELVKRARAVKVHAFIIHYLRKQMPYLIGKGDKQMKLINRLDREFVACARRYGLALGDFPPVEKYQQALMEIKDISKFPRLDKSLVAEMDRVFSHDIPKLLDRARYYAADQAPV
uniref:Dynamin-type G domain-containing protein n=1 Tax=Phaeomonas parva TaxID=124430 RepID=A0A7S1XLP5_9STRA